MIRNALTGEPRDKPLDPQQTDHQGAETSDRAPPLPAAVVPAEMTGAGLTPEAGPTLSR